MTETEEFKENMYLRGFSPATGDPKGSQLRWLVVLITCGNCGFITKLAWLAVETKAEAL